MNEGAAVEPFEVGWNSISQVSPNYRSRARFHFIDEIDKVQFEVLPRK